jgi:hypothetical protein
MADFFTRLGARTLGLAPVARPRMATPYEAAPHLPELNLEVLAAPRAAPHPPAETANPDPAPAARAPRTPLPLAPRPDAPASTARAERSRDVAFAASDDQAPGAPRPARFRPLVPPRLSAPAPSALVPPPSAAEARSRADVGLPSPSAMPPFEPAVPPSELLSSASAPSEPPAFSPPRVAARPWTDASPLRAPWRDARAGEAAPTIQVTIGRVEVRAAPPPAPPPAQRRSALRSLDDYLQPQRRN